MFCLTENMKVKAPRTCYSAYNADLIAVLLKYLSLFDVKLKILFDASDNLRLKTVTA